jgi:hypothetical protein
VEVQAKTVPASVSSQFKEVVSDSKVHPVLHSKRSGTMNSPSSRTRMFSDDGIDANRSRFEPQYVYYPDESTDNEIRFLFTTLKSTEHSTPSDGYEISIRNMPFSYDLSMLISEGGGDKLTFEDVSNGAVVNV